MPDLCDVAHAAAREPYNLHDLAPCSAGLDLYCTDPAQHLTTAGWDLDELDWHLCDPTCGVFCRPGVGRRCGQSYVGSRRLKLGRRANGSEKKKCIDRYGAWHSSHLPPSVRLSFNHSQNRDLCLLWVIANLFYFCCLCCLVMCFGRRYRW